MTAGSSDASTRLLTRGLRLEYVTLAWNVAGTGVILAAALAARSVALAGFGLDSLVKIFASLVVIWQLKGIGRDRERRALRLIGAAFFVLAATLIAMLLLAWGTHATGKQLGNVVLMTEARVTLVDGLLAAAVLVGLVLNAALGWWADPLAGLAIVYYGLVEGRAAWKAE